MAETITPEQLAAPTIAGAPIPTETAQHVAPTPAEHVPKPEPMPTHDNLGRAFDPEKFLKKQDKAGRWVNKNAGRRSQKPNTPKSAPAPSAPIPEVGPAETAASEAASKVEAKAALLTPANQAAQGVAIMIYTAGSLLIDGEEWMPQSGEHDALVTAWEHYFEATGAKEPPVWMAPAMATAIFCGARLAKPKTRTFFAKLKSWLVSKFFARKGEREAAELSRRMESQPATVNPS